MSDGHPNSVSFLCAAVNLLIQFLQTFVSFWDFGNPRAAAPSSGDSDELYRLRLRLLTLMDQVLLVLLTEDFRKIPNLTNVIEDALQRSRQSPIESIRLAQSAMYRTEELNPASVPTVSQFHQPSVQTTTVENARLSIQPLESYTAGISAHAGTSSSGMVYGYAPNNTESAENAFPSSHIHQTSGWNLNQELDRPVVQGDVPETSPAAHIPCDFYRSMPQGTELNASPSQLPFTNILPMPGTANSSNDTQLTFYDTSSRLSYRGALNHNVASAPAFVAVRNATPGPSRLPPPGDEMGSRRSVGSKDKRKRTGEDGEPRKRGRQPKGQKTVQVAGPKPQNPYPKERPDDEAGNRG